MFNTLADDTWKAVAALVILLILAAVIYIEYRWLRRRRWTRQKETTVKDEVYNAILTTKAIASSLARTGVRSMEASELIRKAEGAKMEGDTKAVMEYTGEAKEILMREKLRQKRIGDIAKLPKVGESAPAGPQETAKERLEKEKPKNFMQARFVIDSAEMAIEEGRGGGKNVDEAARLLDMAQRFFEAKDFDSALKYGLLAKKSVEGGVVAAPSAPAVTPSPSTTGTKTCASCGATLRQDDTFCRKCGVKTGPRKCSSCGTETKEGDTFCRKCGVSLS